MSNHIGTVATILFSNKIVIKVFLNIPCLSYQPLPLVHCLLPAEHLVTATISFNIWLMISTTNDVLSQLGKNIGKYSTHTYTILYCLHIRDWP